MSDQIVIYEGVTVLAAELRERAAQAATGLHALGVAAGDAVAILLRNDLPFLEASLASQLVGAYAVPINWHFKADEIMHVIEDCAPKVLVAHADLLRQIAERVPATTTVLVVPTPHAVAKAYRVPADRQAPFASQLAWPTWLDAFAPLAHAATGATESLIYTSGTSGKPKGVKRAPLAPDKIAFSDAMRAQVFGIRPGSRVMVPSPIYHTAPNFFALKALKLAEVLVISAKFDAEAMLRDIVHHRITHLYAVPTIFVRLLELPDEVRAKYDLSSLKFVLHAGGPCPPAVKRRMIDWLGPVICEYYGSTEHGPLTFCDSADWLAHPGTVGRAALGVILRIEGADGQEVPQGGIGEIVARNAAHPDFTYHNLPEERAALDIGGLIRTGDIGYLDEDGFLYLCDRKRDVIISGGVNIYPAEIEAALATCPGLRDSAVFGVPDETYGETIVAVVQAIAPGNVTIENVRAHLAERLARYKQPQVIEFYDALPREDSGKIRKRLIRDAYLSRPATAAADHARA